MPDSTSAQFIPYLLLIPGLVVIIPTIIKIGIWIGGVNSDRNNFNEFMKEVHDNISSIFKILAQKEATENKSPLVLNNLGKKITTNLGANRWVPRYAEHLLSLIPANAPYEIQEFCFEHARRDFLDYIRKNPNEFLNEDDLKTASYENGVNIHVVYEVIGILLRDEILKKKGLESPE